MSVFVDKITPAVYPFVYRLILFETLIILPKPTIRLLQEILDLEKK